MDQATWNKVEAYYSERLLPNDPALEKALSNSREAGLPEIAVAPLQARFLQILASAIGAKRILEIGTLGGYSGIHLARALPDSGLLVTLEFDPKHAEVAEQSFIDAGVADKVEIRIGAALDTLPSIEGSFDLAFLDADKENNRAYCEHCLQLVRPGGLIIVDNVVRDGRVVDFSETDASVEGVRTLAEWVKDEPRLEATALQMVGAKDYDGMMITRVLP